MDAFIQTTMNKKLIELYVWVADKLYTKKIEIEYKDDSELDDLANQKAGEFYNNLIENFDYGWQEIYD